MTTLHQLIERTALAHPANVALVHRDREVAYEALAADIGRVAAGLVSLGVGRQQRIAVYLPKTVETVEAFFGASRAGAVFVPINPLLKSAQVQHILKDSGARVLVTSAERAKLLQVELAECRDLKAIVLTEGSAAELALPAGIEVVTWNAVVASGGPLQHAPIDADIAAILYTSGSTGRPKGVVLSQRNMVAGAQSVAEYLQNTEKDRILAVLPLSFDYGFSQLSTAFLVGATSVLMDYLVPRDVVRVGARQRITGLGAVPPLWVQLADCDWPEPLVQSLRYITNSGGKMPVPIVKKLREKLPKTSVFLMYGLTEAFRSTYLPPEQIERRPDSIGRAIPNAEILVVRPDGSRCAPGEAGELVHRGALVSLGYWNNPESTAERFKPLPSALTGLPLTELAVWSGDTVTMDEEGYLYFVGRRDDMIKTSGYRVSPAEIEEVLYGSGLVGEAAAIGVPHAAFGQVIAVAVTAKVDTADIRERITAACSNALPAYMVPKHIELRATLPRNPNGKIDRVALTAELKQRFPETAGE
jgi:acyl-CoA ligase (AMP-forming) (exosortase A-associated)